MRMFSVESDFTERKKARGECGLHGVIHRLALLDMQGWIVPIYFTCLRVWIDQMDAVQAYLENVFCAKVMRHARVGN